MSAEQQTAAAVTTLTVVALVTVEEPVVVSAGATAVEIERAFAVAPETGTAELELAAVDFAAKAATVVTAAVLIESAVLRTQEELAQ